jgi:RecJ-like exonuclease
MIDDLLALCKSAKKIINLIPKSSRVRVISHYDADGITSAAIMCKAIYRAGYDFHASLMRNPFDKGLARVSNEDNELIIFLDMGSGQIETIEKMGCKSIIVDHHQYLKEKTSENVLQINANLCGINGNYEACGSTLSYSVALAIDKKNSDLGDLAMAGATGDKQYIGGFRGYNKTILDGVLKKGFLSERTEIKLYGDSIYDALYFSVDPYYSKISGNNENIIQILKKLELNTDQSIDKLNDNKMKKLQSILMLKLIKIGCEKNILDTVIRPRYYSDNFYCELERLADLLDSCGKGGNRGLGLELCLGDKDSFSKAVKLEKDYKQNILDQLLNLEENGIKELNGFRYFYSIDSSLGGVIGGIATNFIFDKEKPLISLVKKNDEIHISARGNQFLVKKGLDLGFAMKDVANRIGGHGGGHKIAAGATISSNKEKEFLEMVDKIIIDQIK